MHLVLFTIVVTVAAVPVDALVALCLRWLRLSALKAFLRKVPEMRRHFRALLLKLRLVSPREGEGLGLEEGGDGVREGVATEEATLKAHNGYSMPEEGNASVAARETLQEFWTLHDELRDCLSLPSSYLKAARLRKIQKNADYVIPSVEVEKLVMAAREEIKSYGRSELAIDPSMWVHFDRSETVKRSRFRTRLRSKRELVERVEQVRVEAERIKGDMEAILGGHDEVEKYLFRQFVVHCFFGFERKIARRYVLAPWRTATTAYWLFAGLVLSVLTLLTVFILLIYYLFYLAPRIGSRAMDMWTIVFVLCLLEGTAEASRDLPPNLT